MPNIDVNAWREALAKAEAAGPKGAVSIIDIAKEMDIDPNMLVHYAKRHGFNVFKIITGKYHKVTNAVTPDDALKLVDMRRKAGLIKIKE